MTTDNDKLEVSLPPDFEEEDKTEEQVASLTDTATDSTADPDSQPDDEAPAVVNLEIDPNDISGSISRLMQDDPKVLNVINLPWLVKRQLLSGSRRSVS